MKARSYLLLLLVSLPFLLICQINRDYSKVDRHATKAPKNLEKDLNTLTTYLTSPYQDEFEKARSIYVWITHHIDYDYGALGEKVKRINKHNADILKRKKAICLGYANLFQEMSKLAGLKSFVISGYSKGTLTTKPQMKEPDHAWNAIQLNKDWYLLDATWGTSTQNEKNSFIQVKKEHYFLTPPHLFVLNHLPADPKWQLLKCPVSVELFQGSAQVMEQFLIEQEAKESCLDFKMAITKFTQKVRHEQRLEEAINSYQFNPTPKNKSELGHSYIDYAGILSDQADQLSLEEELDTLVALQEKIITACEQAAGLTELYPWQIELHAQTLINHAVAISRSANTSSEKVLTHLEKAKVLLSKLPPSLFTDQAKMQCDAYIEAFKSN